MKGVSYHLKQKTRCALNKIQNAANKIWEWSENCNSLEIANQSFQATMGKWATTRKVGFFFQKNTAGSKLQSENVWRFSSMGNDSLEDYRHKF